LFSALCFCLCKVRFIEVTKESDGILFFGSVSEVFSTRILFLFFSLFYWFSTLFRRGLYLLLKHLLLDRYRLFETIPGHPKVLYQCYNRITFPGGRYMKNRMTGKGVSDFFVQSLNGMALGLFSSLIIGLILKQIGEYAQLPILVLFGRYAQYLMGPAIGAGVAYALKSPSLAVFASVVTGAIGAGTFRFTDAQTITVVTGEPVGAYISALAGVCISRWVHGKTKVDIVVVPAAVIITGGIAGLFISPILTSFMKWIGEMINMATVLQPIPMGIILAVTMGMILTAPISSAALAISLNLQGLAAGASTIGCCCQMVGFAIASFRENGIGGFIAQGIGTSMLQIPNIIKNPRIWIPPIVSSAILGPVAITCFGMENNSIGAGMGTSGLVGPLATFSVMLGKEPFWSVLTKVIVLQWILPMLVTLFVSEWMRKKGWIRNGDMALMV
jgi:uncharacterized membrane protein